MRITILIILTFLSVNLFSQEYSLKKRYLIWTFHTKNSTINGISIGAYPNLNENNRFVKTNGIRLEIPGLGFLAPIGNGSPISRIDSVSGKFIRKDYKFDEIINGINISTGTIGKVNYNGLTIGGIAQFGILNNGIAIAGIWNAMNKSNGIQVSFLLNEALYSNGLQISIGNSAIIMSGLQIGGYNYAKEMYGVQIGLWNKSQKTKGIQIGIWNINEQRKFPIFNWNFKK
nr:hypothetical protein [uncultured Flavobacterium sp.]